MDDLLEFGTSDQHWVVKEAFEYAYSLIRGLMRQLLLEVVVCEWNQLDLLLIRPVYNPAAPVISGSPTRPIKAPGKRLLLLRCSLTARTRHLSSFHAVMVVNGTMMRNIRTWLLKYASSFTVSREGTDTEI